MQTVQEESYREIARERTPSIAQALEKVMKEESIIYRVLSFASIIKNFFCPHFLDQKVKSNYLL